MNFTGPDIANSCHWLPDWWSHIIGQFYANNLVDEHNKTFQQIKRFREVNLYYFYEINENSMIERLAENTSLDLRA